MHYLETPTYFSGWLLPFFGYRLLIVSDSHIVQLGFIILFVTIPLISSATAINERISFSVPNTIVYLWVCISVLFLYRLKCFRVIPQKDFDFPHNTFHHLFYLTFPLPVMDWKSSDCYYWILTIFFCFSHNRFVLGCCMILFQWPMLWKHNSLFLPYVTMFVTAGTLWLMFLQRLSLLSVLLLLNGYHL